MDDHQPDRQDNEPYVNIFYNLFYLCSAVFHGSLVGETQGKGLGNLTVTISTGGAAVGEVHT